MRLADLEFDLPDASIARYPAVHRDQSRLLVVDRKHGQLQHRSFADILEFLRPEDALVINETKVLPARICGHKLETGGRVELLLIDREEGDGIVWRALARPANRLHAGTVISILEGALEAVILGKGEVDGRFRVAFRRPSIAGGTGGDDAAGTVCDDEISRLVAQEGQVPLPPYLGREPEPEDLIRYQTVYARKVGAVAAPTAGLHFTEALLDQIEGIGVGIVRILLHVGPGTFEPIRTEDPCAHKLEAEFYEVSAAAAAELNQRRQAGGRIIPVGTTSVRTLETVSSRSANNAFQPSSGWTDLFVHEPFDFQATDALITNFHLPRSSLLLLVAAFVGLERLKDAYKEAISEHYRFYSYGDAMLIL
jgi:S-adenosylmethionine:tRNA ribosyltransferase-isomerase